MPFSACRRSFHCPSTSNSSLVGLGRAAIFSRYFWYFTDEDDLTHPTHNCFTLVSVLQLGTRSGFSVFEFWLFQIFRFFGFSGFLGFQVSWVFRFSVFWGDRSRRPLKWFSNVPIWRLEIWNSICYSVKMFICKQCSVFWKYHKP